MKIAISGASGPFGSATAQGLLDRGIKPGQLILLSRHPAQLQHFADLGAEARYGDFDDYDSLVKALAGADRMLMISTNRVGQREPQHTNAVRAAVAAGVKHVFYTSFVGTPETVSLAVHDHRFTENLLRGSGLNWTFLRNSQYTEAMRDAGFPIAIKDGRWFSASGEGRIAMVTREDCIKAAVAALATPGHENRKYDITGPELVSYQDLAALASELSGRDIAFVSVDEAARYAMFDAIGVPRSAKDDHVVNGFGWCSDDMVSFETTIRLGGFAVISDDIELLTGHKPESVRSFLSRSKDLFRAIAAESNGT